MEVSEEMFFDSMKKQRELVDRIRERISSVLGISVKVKLVEPGALERTEGKAKRVVDRREIS